MVGTLFETGQAVAWVFPGQGSQAVGMGKALFDAQPEIRDLYRAADEILGYALSDLCFNGPNERLQQTNHAQPALLVTSIAHLQALRSHYPGEFERARSVAGHSLGEYTALVVAGALRFEDAVRLVAERGRLMQAAGASGGGTGMLAIIGMPDEELTVVCAEAGVDLANINAPGQVVLSGPLDALGEAEKIAKEHGARKVVLLPVSAAFHSRWMRPMSEEFSRSLASTQFETPLVEVVANVTAEPVRSAEAVRLLLEKQTYSSVRWVGSVQYMVGEGVSTFVEIGPGKVLSGLIKRISPEARILSSEELLA